MSVEKEKFKTMDLDELALERKKFQDKIDGPENDGRITSDGSADLDYWMEMVEDLTDEISKRLYSKEEKTKNRIQHVLFDPVAVGWGIGLIKSIENTEMMHVPLGVKTQKHLDSVKGLFPNVNIIIVS